MSGFAFSAFFALQDEVARDIAKSFQIKVGALVERGAVNPEMHRLVLQGRHAWNQFNEGGFVQAEVAFAKALEIDPGCATASAGFALVGCRRALLRGVASRHQEPALAEAERHARQALQFDASLAEPHAVLGTLALLRGELGEAERESRQALRLNPNSDLALVYHARLLQRQGRPDLAVPELEDAHRLSPLVGAYAGHRGTALLACRRHAESVAVVQYAEELAAGSPWSRAIGAIALARLGRRDEAVIKARTALDTGPKGEWTRGFAAWGDGLAAWALAEAGARDEAETIVRQLQQEPEARRFSAGFALATLGDREEGFALLEDMPQWLVDHVMIFADQNEAVRTDPRFNELLRKLDAREAFETLKRILHNLEAKR